MLKSLVPPLSSVSRLQHCLLRKSSSWNPEEGIEDYSVYKPPPKPRHNKFDVPPELQNSNILI